MSLSTLTPQWSIQIRRSLLLFILILIFIYPLCQIKGNVSSSKIQICQYSLDVKSSYANVSTHYYGSQLVVLESLKNESFFGYISWNLTWDEGTTWQFFNTTYLYLPNRTYSHSNISLFTSWWIIPNVQIGNLIHIDGDPPATNFFPRSAPFRVSELTSLNIGSNHYTCWLLSYETTSGQQERFYYEQWTGILLAVYSKAIKTNSIQHEIHLALETANPNLPQTNRSIQLFLEFGSQAIAFLIALLSAWMALKLLQKAQQRRLQSS